MLTLTPHKDNIQIAQIRHGKQKKRTPLFWHPTIKPELRNSMESLDYFFTEDFRDRFELSQEQASSIQQCLACGKVDEKNQVKFFKCKRFIQEALNEELDICDQADQIIEVPFPKGGDTFPWTAFVCGNSGSGKTRWCCDRILQNLEGPVADRRHFIYFSAELDIDQTLAPLRDNEKYKDRFVGVDISDKAVRDSQYENAEDFFKNEVQLRIDTAPPGSVAVADDAQDGAEGLCELMRKLITKLQRVGRHQKIGLMFLLHKLYAGLWTNTAYSSARYIVVFPRSMKSKIRDFLEREIGMLRKDAKRAVKDFGQSARAMICRMHCPQALISEKLCRLI